MIDTVIFDFGNVFTLWDPFLAIGDRYSVAEFNKFAQDVNLMKLVEEWDAGDSHEDTRRKIIAKDNELSTNWIELYDYYLPRFSKSISNLVPDMLELVQDLQAKGIRTYGLTNWSFEDIDDARATIPAVAAMQGIVVSGEEKVSKPDPKIFEILFERYNIDPKHAIFIDDRADNIATAQSFGITGFLNPAPFEETAKNFRAFLESEGVL